MRLAFDALRVRADAEVKPVPAHSTKEGGKSAKIVALQLLKRNRNLRYEKRSGRFPPSVMLAKMAAETVTSGASIAWALDAISAKVLSVLEDAERTGVLIDVRNPRCEDERLTDRWPEDRQAQRLYISDLRSFRTQLANLMSEEFSLPQKRNLLAAMFGVGPAQAVIDEYADSLGRAVEIGKRYVAPSGRVVPATVLTSAPLPPPPPRSHAPTRSLVRGWTRK